MSEYIDFPALGQVLLAASLGGIGLVALFALGLRGVSWKVDENRGAAGPCSVKLREGPKQRGHA